jgi:putative endonuclease
MSEHIVYILSGAQPSCENSGPVFINSTPDLLRRVTQHRSGRIKQSQFRIDRLVYVESYDCAFKAQARVRALKTASREWLDALITSRNPSWQELLPVQRSSLAA